MQTVGTQTITTGGGLAVHLYTPIQKSMSKTPSSDDSPDEQSSETDLSVAERYGLTTPDWDVNANGNPVLDEQLACAITEALDEGDTVTINGRSEPLTVEDLTLDRNHSPMKTPEYPFYQVWLTDGEETMYRIRWSNTAQQYPQLTRIDNIETKQWNDSQNQESVPRTVYTGPSSLVHWICPTYIDRNNVVDWAFSRLLAHNNPDRYSTQDPFFDSDRDGE